MINPIHGGAANVARITAIAAGFGGFVSALAARRDPERLGSVAIIAGSVTFGTLGCLFASLVVTVQRVALTAYQRAARRGKTHEGH